MVQLYKKDSKGKIRIWQIEVVSSQSKHNPNRLVYSIATSDGIQGGKMKDPVTKEAVPNNLYKTSQAKAEAMMQSAIDKKLRSNYFRSIDEIKNENTLFMPTGCPSGMIWEDYKNKDHVVYPALASPKLDGSKMYSTWRDGRVFLNTRSAKEHKNFRHIEEALSEFYETNPHIVLDGEAYNHEYRNNFEELQSIFRKESPTDDERQLSKDVSKFYIYDVVDLRNPNQTAKQRQGLLDTIFRVWFGKLDCIVKWGSTIVKSEADYDKFHNDCMDNGFEGSVLKIFDAPYVQRKNKNVMKRKPKFDCEFEIVDIIEGTGTAKGVAASVTIDLTFVEGMNISQRKELAEDFQDAGIAKGWNHKQLKELLKNKEDHIGKMATIEYGGVTAYGKLRFPKFKAIRED